MTAKPRLCRCGLPMDTRGLCPHCDARPATPCGPKCPQCEYARHRCEVCGVRFATIPQAVHHAAQDRINENQRGNQL